MVGGWGVMSLIAQFIRPEQDVKRLITCVLSMTLRNPSVKGFVLSKTLKGSIVRGRKPTIKWGAGETPVVLSKTLKGSNTTC